MNVKEEMLHRYNGPVTLYAEEFDPEETQRLINSYQAAWDSGKSFVKWFSLTAKRESDSEDEISACVNGLHDSLTGLVANCWAKKLTREQVVALLNALDYEGEITLCKGMPAMNYIEVMRLWHGQHPDEDKISIPDSWLFKN